MPTSEFSFTQNREFFTEQAPKYSISGGKIKALKDFGTSHTIHKDDKGGKISSESNLSQLGHCWIYQDAQVTGSASIRDAAQVTGKAQVSGNSIVADNAVVADNATIKGNSFIYESSTVSGNSKIQDSKIHGSSNILDDATVDNSELINVLTIGSTKIKDSYIKDVTLKNCVLKDAWIEDQRDIQRVGAIAGKEFIVYYKGPGEPIGCSYTQIVDKAGSKEVSFGLAQADSIDELISDFDKEKTSQQHGKTHQKNRYNEYKKMIEAAITKLLSWRTDNQYQPRTVDKYFGFPDNYVKGHDLSLMFPRPDPKSY